MPADSSYILEIDNKPALAGSLYYSNSENFCMIDNFVGNPDLAGAERRAATRKFLDRAEALAKERGYRRLFCMTTQDGPVEYYKRLGFQVTGQGVTTLIKEL
jgi:N-acetylglutamate synthase-like GNAT family acetyltransferase